MLKPTRENQKKWVEKHLNGGVYDWRSAYERETWEKEKKYSGHRHACWQAMKWLDEANVKTLAEAWRRCQNGEWMSWALYQMEPTEKEERIILRARMIATKAAMRSATDKTYQQKYAREMRKLIPNPWVMKNWKAGLGVKR